MDCINEDGGFKCECHSGYMFFWGNCFGNRNVVMQPLWIKFEYLVVDSFQSQDL